ncbi:MAG: uracil-DNA glycosylase family protein [Halieaceae bacterium]
MAGDSSSNIAFTELLASVNGCRLCEDHLPLGARPVVQVDPRAVILIAGQAPGLRVHESGVPFDDPSGDRLRDWLGMSKEVFYDPSKVAILPMGFCYPGTGKSGDLPPRPECEKAWRKDLLGQLTEVRLTLLVGKYAQRWHLAKPGRTLTGTVQAWRDYAPEVFPLPHPSPRNNIWLKRNPWFKQSLLPDLAGAVIAALD